MLWAQLPGGTGCQGSGRTPTCKRVGRLTTGDHAAELISFTDDDRLPCRTTLKLEGLEWFVYNRGPAYDMLLERLQAQQDALGGGLNRHTTNGATSIHLEPAENELPKPPPANDPDAIDWFRETLPVEIQVTRGAVVVGNKSTPSLLIAGFRSALGTCGAVKVRIHKSP